jgi:ketosteroid isomerase-like protein
MKNILLLFALHLLTTSLLQGQHIQPSDRQRKDIHSLIDQYSEARERSDTLLLKSILTADIDQLVSTGEWRNGIRASMKGMQKSSANNAGTRTLTIEKIRLFNMSCAIVDCKYEIKNPGGTVRKMWSTFIVISDKGVWKISAIRNMLPQ